MIRPISRDNDSSRVKAGAKTVASLGLKENISINRNNKVNSADANDKPKETLIIDKDPLLVPIDTWKDNTQVVINLIDIILKPFLHF